MFRGNQVQSIQPQQQTGGWGADASRAAPGINNGQVQQPAFGQQQPGYGQPPQPAFGQPPQPGFGNQGQGFGGQPQNQQMMQQPSSCPCCGPQPGQPAQAGCFDIFAPPTPPQQHMCYGALQYCDSAVWMAVLIFVFSLAGLAATLGSVKPDDLYAIYPDLPEKTSSALQQALNWDATPNREAYAKVLDYQQHTPTPSPTPKPCRTPTCPPCAPNGTQNATETFAPTVTQTPTATPKGTNDTTSAPSSRRRLLQTRYPLPRPNLTECVGMRTIFGMRGSLCRGSMLTAEQFLAHVSRWVNFREMLYFICLCASVVLVVYVRLIYRVKHPQEVMAAVSPPIEFDHTELYAVVMAAWFTLGFFIFFLVCNEMHSYWSVIEYYKSNTSGPLNTFWMEFDEKFVPSVILVTIVLCWPWLWAWVQIGIFIPFYILWFIFRSACVQQLGQLAPDAKPVPWKLSVQQWAELPLVLRIDIWFSEFHRFSRYGFGQLQWEMITGKKIGNTQQPMGQYPSAVPQNQPGMGPPRSSFGNADAPAQPQHIYPSQQEKETVITMPREQPPALNASATLGSSHSSLRKCTVVKDADATKGISPHATSGPENNTGSRRGSESELKPNHSLKSQPSGQMSTDDEGAKVDKPKKPKKDKKKHKDEDKDKESGAEGEDKEKKPKREKSHRKDKGEKGEGEGKDKHDKHEKKSKRDKEKKDKDETEKPPPT